MKLTILLFNLFLFAIFIYAQDNKLDIQKMNRLDSINNALNNMYVGRDDLRKDSYKALWKDSSLFFPLVKFNKVIGYAFNKGINQEGTGEDQSIIDYKSKKMAKSVYYKTVPLTKGQIDDLLIIINDISTYCWGNSGCFVPKYAFIFYNNRKIVAFMEIGDCSQINANPWTPIMRDGGLATIGLNRFRKYCKKIGLPDLEDGPN